MVNTDQQDELKPGRKRITYAEALQLMKGLLMGYHNEFVLPYVDERIQLYDAILEKKLRELFPEKFDHEVEESQSNE